MGNRMDRRTKYTQRVLNESLIHFLEQKEITKISVTEICKEADVNRSTYYAYYTDPFDQFTKLKNELLGAMTENTVRIDTQTISPDQTQYVILRSILEFADTQKRVFRILLGRSGDHNLQEELLSILGEKAFRKAIPTHKTKEEIQYLLNYASNGCFGLFYHWLMTDELTAEQTARLMADFTGKLLRD